MEKEKRKKWMIGLSITLVVLLGGVVLLATKASAKKTSVPTPPIPTNKDSNATDTPASCGMGLTTPAHQVACGKVSYTLNGATITGIVCNAPMPPKGNGGPRCHSDQMVYGVPSLRCIEIS